MENGNTTPQLTRANLDVALVTSKDKFREPLHNVLIDGDCTVATDSYALIKCDTLSNGHRRAVIGKTDAKDFAKLIGKGQGTLTNSGDDKYITVSDGMTNRSVPTVQHDNFPKYEQIMDSEREQLIELKYDAKVLKSVVDYLAKHATGKQNQATITIKVAKPNKDGRNVHPIQITAKTEHGQAIDALVMPLYDER